MLLDLIRNHLSQSLLVDEALIDEGTGFEEVGAEAVDLIELVMVLEARLGIQLDDELLERVQTIGDLIGLVEDGMEGA